MIDSRSKRVLLAVVESYIDSPEPVGSRYVTKKYEFGLSSASIRNIMADLEDLGLLMQPHTSAGRVPTDMGYRFYVENILNPSDEAECSEQIINRIKSAGGDVDDLVQETTRIISTFSHYLAVASLPRTENSTFHKIELIRYKSDRIVVMLFTDEGIIKHKIISNDMALKQPDLSRIASYLNSRFSGMKISDIRVRLIKEMKKQKDECDLMISRAMDIFGDATSQSGDEVFVSGFKEVVNLPDFSDIDKIKKLYEAIEDKHAIVKILDRIAEDMDVQVIIGSENQIDDLKNLSMVAASYKDHERPVGVIGIIGPTRMDYQSAIAIVDTASKCLSFMLRGQ